MKNIFALGLFLASILAIPGFSWAESIIVSAPTLAKDYANNELAADKKYRGKGGLTIHGTVDSVQRTFGQIQILLKGQNMFNFVYINLNKGEADIASELEKGHEISVRCDDVLNIAGFVHASGCGELEPPWAD